ncbi:hypothetical protein TorRG33x02_172260 [Trema orientale]|uniref:Uncharacterized protein n=1 Tax=Trema orientale TaxID=63057 RepID=A0A2P5EN92_TREOI|nr:hypothetical protein TorRG33x02_172260 [Trema orientale]
MLLPPPWAATLPFHHCFQHLKCRREALNLAQNLASLLTTLELLESNSIAISSPCIEKPLKPEITLRSQLTKAQLTSIPSLGNLFTFALSNIEQYVND